MDETRALQLLYRARRDRQESVSKERAGARDAGMIMARQLQFVVHAGSEHLVRLDDVVADLRELSPEALTRCARVIRVLAQAESDVRRARADQTRQAASRPALAATRATDAAHQPSTARGDQRRQAVARHRSVGPTTHRGTRPFRSGRR